MAAKLIGIPAVGEGTEPVRAGTARRLVELRTDIWEAGEVSTIWMPRGDLIVERAQIHAGSAGGRSEADVRRRYGRLWEPGDAPSLHTVERESLVGRVLRLRLQFDTPSETGDEAADEPVLAFVGFLDTPQTRPDAAPTALEARGDQTLVAHGPELLLQRTEIHESWWNLNGAMRALGRLPGFNERTTGGEIRGNRAAQLLNGLPYFGGSEVWTRYDMLQHVITLYVQQRDALGQSQWPVWSLSGDYAALVELTDPVELEGAQNAEELLKRIVDPNLDVDYVLLPTEQGFAVHIFGLVAERAVPAGWEGPVNRRRYELSLAAEPQTRVVVEEDAAQLYDRIVLVGQPIVMCLSADGGGISPAPTENELVAGWPAARQTAFEAGAGALAVPEQHAAARAQDSWRDVFRAYRFEPGTWQDGAAHPQCTFFGGLIADELVGRQTLIRATRPQLPLRDGYDYTTGDPVWVGAAGTVPELRPPLALVYVDATVGWVPVDKLTALGYGGASVQALAHEWGVRIETHPPQLLARGHWAESAAYDGFDPDIEGLDYANLVVTFAIELDHRVRVGAELPVEVQSGYGRTKVVEVPQAELHLVAPHTVVGVDTDGTLVYSPEVLYCYVRDDRPLLHQMLPGAIARHLRERLRASVTRPGTWPELGALGAVLEIVDGVGLERVLNGPITSVVWEFGDEHQAGEVGAAFTRLGAGGAQR